MLNFVPAVYILNEKRNFTPGGGGRGVTVLPGIWVFDTIK